MIYELVKHNFSFSFILSLDSILHSKTLEHCKKMDSSTQRIEEEKGYIQRKSILTRFFTVSIFCKFYIFSYFLRIAKFQVETSNIFFLKASQEDPNRTFQLFILAIEGAFLKSCFKRGDMFELPKKYQVKIQNELCSLDIFLLPKKLKFFSGTLFMIFKKG